MNLLKPQLIVGGRIPREGAVAPAGVSVPGTPFHCFPCVSIKAVGAVDILLDVLWRGSLCPLGRAASPWGLAWC